MKQEYRIDKRHSPNSMSRKGWKPDIIVSHIMEGYYNTGINWLCNPKSGASSHFVVSKKGEITQLVDIKRAAWINGTSTNRSKNNHYSKSSLQDVRNRKTNANYYTIGIEHEGFYKDNQGKLTPEQFKATVWLHKHIRNEIKRIYGMDIPINREHIVGHYQIDPIRKPNCPGRLFQFEDLMSELKGVKKMKSMNENIPSKSHKDNWELAIELGLTDGSKPQEVATREQIATMIIRALNLTSDTNNSDKHWAYRYYEELNNQGIEINDKRFNEFLKRGELFKLMSESRD